MHSVEFTDKNEGEPRKFPCIARTPEEVPEKLIMETIMDREEPEVAVVGQQVAILFRQCSTNGGPMLLV